MHGKLIGCDLVVLQCVYIHVYNCMCVSSRQGRMALRVMYFLSFIHLQKRISMDINVYTSVEKYDNSFNVNSVKQLGYILVQKVYIIYFHSKL